MASYLDPSTTASYEEPWAGGMRRGYLESIFNLAQQPTPVPVRQVAGLDPMEMQAREMAGGLGGFSPYIKQGGEMMQQGAGYFTPAGIQQFYNPYEQDVVQQTLQDAREENARRGIEDRSRAISQGAFGGSRGRLMEQERERSFGRGMMEGVGGIRQAGYAGAQQAAQRAGQGLGTLGGQLGQFGQGLGALGGQLGQFGQGLTGMAGQYGQLGRGMGQMGGNMANLGMTGQQGLMNQIGMFDRFGQTGRGIQGDMYGAQFDAANRMAQEPWQRMGQWGGMMSGMMPKTGAVSKFGAAAGVDPMAGILALLGLKI